jgi:integrase
MNEITWQPMDDDRGVRYGELFRIVRARAIKGVRDDAGGWLIKPCPSLKTLTDQDLRDTAVTWMARGGASIPEICAVTGHSLQSATTILRHYLETNPEMADKAIDAMVGYWEAQITAENQNDK